MLAPLETEGAPPNDPRRAMRALQVFDEAVPMDVYATHPEFRARMMQVLDTLASLVGGVHCSGEDEGDGNYIHNGTTCPVHEWLEETDSLVHHRGRPLVFSAQSELSA